MTLSVHNSGSYIEPDEVFVKDGGVWRTTKELHVKDGGAWRKIFPIAGTQTFNGGTTSFVIPQGVYSLSFNLMSGGGGGGRSGQHTGDCHSGAAGYAGGVVNSVAFVVTPGETLTVIVGAGGSGGVYPGFQQGYRSGTVGGATYIKRGSTALYTATGGAINNGQFYSGSNFVTPGQTNGSGYGTGGTGGSCEGNGGTGVAGVVRLLWS